MNQDIPNTSDDDVAALDALCERLQAFDERVSLEWLDGYLTALAAGPVKVDVQQRLDVLADGVFPRVFADPADAAAGRALIAQRFAVLCAQLDPEALLEDPDVMRLAPLMIELASEDIERLRGEGVPEEELQALQRVGEIWVLGFVEAIDDQGEVWPTFDGDTPADEDAAQRFDVCMRRIAVLAEDDEALQSEREELYEGEELTRDDWVTEALYGVQDLKLYWLDYPVKPAQRLVGHKPGRNDPCPCGSGVKYKRCHGAASS